MSLLLNLCLFVPVAASLAVLLIPARRWRLVRALQLATTALVLVGVGAMWAVFLVRGPSPLFVSSSVPWVPSIGASYAVALDGLSLSLWSLTTVLFFAVSVYVAKQEERASAHAALFLLMQTGLLGVFAARDLLLFYLFFEIALVPMYFVIGAFGHGRRRYSAMKFFLYTRGASLAMLLGILGIYLSIEPHTFSLGVIVREQPLAAATPYAVLVFFGLLLGFAVKVPSVPLHNWLPDAHVDAPTEGSIILAGLQLKMGGYGLFRVMLPAVPGAAEQLAWLLIALGIVSLLYGSLAALAQNDFKRLIAYSSVAHMGYVVLAAGVYAVAPSEAVRDLALAGAAFQMVSHGLLTGGMFLLAGITQDAAGTRDMTELRGLLRGAPVLAAVLAVLAFGSLGIPGMSGFIAELQVIGATLGVSFWAAVLTVVGLIVTTALYLVVVSRLVLGEPGEATRRMSAPSRRELAVAGALAVLSFVLGVAPMTLLWLFEGGGSVLLSGVAP